MPYLRAGVWLLHACCHGLCATCKVQVKHGEASPFALMDFESEEGKCAASRMTPPGHFDNDFRDRKA